MVQEDNKTVSNLQENTIALVQPYKMVYIEQLDGGDQLGESRYERTIIPKNGEYIGHRSDIWVLSITSEARW